ncbi:hypothetical protein Riv7116_4352 [Rivularia sp. PCC 7116]|uniref:hypothetical protein n=1 Tax=Rivularia sp. PCC 7116 TaxID=373994 RepID=UPI00029EC7A0|nr:hypothetical protein [Rivularia sp. PCC 7116]AFY56778.1 hypothetical protein Riv7116_4352 [Rivularia sp. PCC 7116]
MYVGTTEAAEILNIKTSQMRYLLSHGRVKGAYKSGHIWIIPLFNRMPIISRGKRGPKPKWCRRIPAKTTINVNKHKIKQNLKRENPEPVISVKRYDSNTYGFSAKINGPCEIIYRPEKPLDCGSVLWIETFASIEVKPKKIEKQENQADVIMVAAA